MKALVVAVLSAALLPILPAQDPAKGLYRAPITPDPLHYTPMTLLSVTPTGLKFALDALGNILNGTDTAWQKLPGNLIQISGGSDTETWGVNADHAVFRWNGTTWATMPGVLQQVAVAKGGGLVMGIEWAEPHRVVRWDPATNSWIPLPGAPPLVQLAIGSPNLVYGIIDTGSIFRLNRTKGWTEWQLIKGKLKQISVGIDGTVGGIGIDGVAYVRSDQDITAEMNDPTNITAYWVSIPGPIAFVEILKVTDYYVLDKSGYPAKAVLQPVGNIITSSDMTVQSPVTVNTTVLGNGFTLSAPDGPKTESSGCVTISSGSTLSIQDPTPAEKQYMAAHGGSLPLSRGSIRCPTTKFTKIAPSGCAPNGTLPIGQGFMLSNNKGGCSDSTSEVTSTDPPQIDGKGADCAPRTFLNRSAHSSVQFSLPGGRKGEAVIIPAGAHNHYVFPACNRVVWDDLVFVCMPTKVWVLAGGKYDADAYCTGTPGRSPYTSISDLGYADK